MWVPCGSKYIPCCSLLAQDLGNAIQGPQIGAQSVMQALIINARLSFSIGQRCLALDHTFGEPASQNGMCRWWDCQCTCSQPFR